MMSEQGEMRRSKVASRLTTVLAIVAAAFALDQATKWLMLNVVLSPPQVIALAPFFNLRLGFNTGVSFGMFKDVFDDLPWILTVFKVVVATGLIAWALRTESGAERIGLSLIAGGALGNALDRWREGAVTDFLDFHYAGWHWPTFNMADVAIVCGAALLMASGLFGGRSKTAMEA
jgi:signal peptidase II